MDSVLTPTSIVVGDSDLVDSGVVADADEHSKQEKCFHLTETDVDMKIHLEPNSYVAHVQILPSDQVASGQLQHSCIHANSNQIYTELILKAKCALISLTELRFHNTISIKPKNSKQTGFAFSFGNRQNL